MKLKRKVASPLTRMNAKVEILVLHDQNAAAAYAELDMGAGEMVIAEATGSAKREPGDTRDDMIAAHLAVGRALVSLGRQLQATGRSQVKAATAIRDRERAASIAHVLRGVRPAQERLLPVSEIRERYGAEAADRSASRREPRGRHGRDGQKG